MYTGRICLEIRSFQGIATGTHVAQSGLPDGFFCLRPSYQSGNRHTACSLQASTHILSFAIFSFFHISGRLPLTISKSACNLPCFRVKSRLVHSWLDSHKLSDIPGVTRGLLLLLLSPSLQSLASHTTTSTAPGMRHLGLLSTTSLLHYRSSEECSRPQKSFRSYS